MRFDVAGPFEISRHGKKSNITKESICDLRKHIEEWEVGLSEACGCYVFAKRAGGGITPWYVGQACRSPMLREALNSNNIVKYNSVIDDDKGTPLLFLIPARTSTGKLKKRPENGSSDEIRFLERWLISAAIEKNPFLINDKDTKFLRDLHVVGIFNARQGEFTAASQELKKALWR